MANIILELPLDAHVTIALDAMVRIPAGGAPLKVEGLRIGSVVEYLGATDDGERLRVRAEIDPEHEGFLGVVEMGLIEGVRLP